MRMLVIFQLLAFASPLQGQFDPCTDSFSFLTVSDQDDIVRKVDPFTFEVTSEISMSIPGAIGINGIRGIAIHPTTGNWFLLAMTSLPPSPSPAPWLMEYNPITDTLNILGFTVLDFNDLDFRENGDLRAITNTLSTGSSNYCELSTITGGPSDLCQYPGSEGGDTIALGSGDEVFHASGGYSVGGPAEFERPSAGGSNSCDSALIPIGSNLSSEPVRSLTYWPDEDVFLWVQGDTARSAYLVTEDGGDTFLGTFDHAVNGIAFSGNYSFIDCNGNGVWDECEISAGSAPDCNTNGIIDTCEIAQGTPDCNQNGIPDFCEYSIENDCNLNSILDECELNTDSDSNADGILDSCQEFFIRGDCNTIGTIDIADAIFLLGYLFSGFDPSSCEDACDVNDDSNIDIGDGIYILTALFIGGDMPPPPFPACGVDPTDDLLGCESFGGC